MIPIVNLVQIDTDEQMSQFFHQNKTAAVPRLPLSLLELAHHCAEEVWRGYNYQGSQFERASDEFFLIAFAGHHFYPHTLNRKRLLSLKPKAISEDLILVLNYVADIGVARRLPDADYQAAVTWLQRNRRVGLRRWMVRTSYASSVSLGAALINDLSIEFSRKISPDQRFSLISNRIAFFAFPEIDIFNFSEDIAHSFRIYYKTPDIAMAEYQRVLYDGFLENWDQLARFRMPNSEVGEQLFVDIIRKGNWWQRRVFDLALKIRASRETGCTFSSGVIFRLSDGPCKFL
jgi:hypothetical protein